MCGFVGGMLQRTVDDARLDSALDALHHRGPDARGRWVSDDGRWFLGHTRLSIIGLENGAQPIYDAEVVRGIWKAFPTAPDEERLAMDGLFNRVVSMTLMHDRFGMSG